MPEHTEQPDSIRCPAVTFPAPGMQVRCTILMPPGRDSHGGLHRWEVDDYGQLPQTAPKGPKTLPEAVLGLGVYGLTLAFVAFIIAWFTR